MDKQERKKELMDILVFVFFFIWLAMRILSYTSIEGIPIFLFFSKLIIILMGLPLISFFSSDSSLLADEFDRLNKYKAFKFSWFFTILEAAVLFILCKASLLEGTLAVEILLWSGYFSYFVSYKFFDHDLGSHITDKRKKRIKSLTTSVIQIMFGAILGFTMINETPDDNEKMIYPIVGISLVLLGSSIMIIWHYLEKRGKSK